MKRQLIENALVFTMDGQRRVLRGDVLIEDDKVAQVGRGLAKKKSLASLPARARVDGTGTLLMPGLIQTHVHLCQALFRGMADDLPLLDWLKERIWPLEGAHTKKSLRASAQLGVAEMLLAGTTSILDMGTVHHQDAVFEVLLASGIRAWSGKAMMDRGVGVPKTLRETTTESLSQSEALFDRWDGKGDGRLHYAFAPRFILSCSESLLRKTAALATTRGALIHSHASEHPGERAAVQKAVGTSDVRALAAYGISGEQTVLAHGVQLTDKEMKFVAGCNTRFVHCPSANLKLASGIADVHAMREAGIVVGLGADGAPCNNRMDPWTELRQAALLSKGVHNDARRMNAWEALELVTTEGARVLGCQDTIGSIEVGKQADLTLVDLAGLHLPPLPSRKDLLADAAAALLVYSATASDVRDVFVAGQHIVRNRKLKTLDVAQIGIDVAREAKSIRKRAAID